MGCTDNALHRWTSPTIELAFPLSVDFIDKIRITFAQGVGDDGKPNIVIVKTEADATFEQNKVVFKLLQEDTLLLSADQLVSVEVQVYDVHGEPFVSDVVKVRAEDVINEGVSW